MTELYHQRRERLRNRIHRDGRQVAAILESPTPARRSADGLYKYRPSSHVLYLSGFAEPNTVLLVLPESHETPFVMFVPPRDPEKEQWTGRRVGVDGAKEQYGADAAYSIDELDEKLPKLLDNVDELYVPFDRHEELERRIRKVTAGLRHRRGKPASGPTSISDLDRVLAAMRRIKSPAEIDIMRAAAKISAQGHNAARQAIRPGMTEYEVEAVINHAFRQAGGVGPAFDTIVGGGDNGTILHYIENSDVLQDGDLVLIDAGAEFRWYSGDITRTHPVGEKFSSAQRDVYQIVLAAEKAGIEACRPGARFHDRHDAALDVLIRGMLDLKLLEGSVDEVKEEKSYKRYFMHSTSHYLGMDTHDVGDAYLANGESAPFEEGVVITVEPGLYIRAADEEAPEHLRGIGVRIEDDVLITAKGHEILTGDTPKEIAELEA